MVILLMEVFGVGLDCFFGIVFMVGFILLGILDCYWMVMIIIWALSGDNQQAEKQNSLINMLRVIGSFIMPICCLLSLLILDNIYIYICICICICIDIDIDNVYVGCFGSVVEQLRHLAEELVVFSCQVLFLQFLNMLLRLLVSARPSEPINNQVLTRYPQQTVLCLKRLQSFLLQPV